MQPAKWPYARLAFGRGREGLQKLPLVFELLHIHSNIREGRSALHVHELDETWPSRPLQVALPSLLNGAGISHVQYSTYYLIPVNV